MAELNLRTIQQHATEPLGDLKKLSASAQAALLLSRADTTVTRVELEARLTESKRTKRPLQIKLGVDATGPVMHLGHVVTLLTAQLLQKMGHHLTFVVGDFTATIGDPSGRIKERPVLTTREVARNVRTYEKQAALFINLQKADVRFNSEWLTKLKVSELFGYLRLQTVAQAMEREDFRTRPSVTRAELLYASLQGIDSVKLKTDLEIGGRDQLLNFIEARELMHRLGTRPQTILTTPLLPGTDGTGKKMSKSAGNFIAVTESAAEMYGKVMAVADQDVLMYFKLLTFLPADDLKQLTRSFATGGTHRRDIKMLLAGILTGLVHPSATEVQTAERSFERTFGQHQRPAAADVPKVTVSKKTVKDLPDLLVRAKIAPSRSEAKRLVQGGSISRVDEHGKRTTVGSVKDIAQGGMLQIGKRRFVEVRWR